MNSPFPPPRSPLPPHRLAKLANALGISAPIPIFHSEQQPSLRTPSPASAYSTPTPSSKFLLHVTPPPHLPLSISLALSRGSLLPLHPTIQAQLGAIAREYALPSTAGLVLYLSPGPKLSEDIWKIIWRRVLAAEKEEASSPPPTLLGLGLSNATLSPPCSRSDTPNSHRFPSPRTPSTSATRSSSSDRGQPRNTSGSTTEPTSAHPDPSDIMLPGLDPSSLLPIVAKVEFDIETHAAPWYEPWARRRRLRLREQEGGVVEDGDSDEMINSSGLRELRLRTPEPSFDNVKRELEGYAQLQDNDDDDNSEPECQADSEVAVEVFPDDATTWADIHADGQPRNSLDPAMEPPQAGSDTEGDTDEQDILDLLKKNNRPSLSVSIPTPSKNRGSKHVPPPLNLKASLRVSEASSPIASTPAGSDAIGTTSLPYLKKEDDSIDAEDETVHMRTPIDLKREVAIYDDLVLKFGDDQSDDGPFDRRSSQFLMAKQLDEIEKNLVQFSPRALKSDISQDDDFASRTSSTTSSFSMALSAAGDLPARLSSLAHRSFSPPPSASSRLNIEPPRSQTTSPQLPDVAAPIFRPPRLIGSPSPKGEEFEAGPSRRSSGRRKPSDSIVTSQPDVRRSSEEDATSVTTQSSPRLKPKGPRTTPPRFALNNRPSLNRSRSSSSHSKKVSMGAVTPATSDSAFIMPPEIRPMERKSSSPVLIPLSPDPFGRKDFTEQEQDETHDTAAPLPSSTPQRESTLSSRFSADSSLADHNTSPTATTAGNRNTMMSVKSIRRLWRKSAKAVATLPPPLPSTSPPPQQPQLQQDSISNGFSQPQASSSTSTSTSMVDVVQLAHRLPGYPLHPALASQRKGRPPSGSAKTRDSQTDLFHFDSEGGDRTSNGGSFTNFFQKSHARRTSNSSAMIRPPTPSSSSTPPPPPLPPMPPGNTLSTSAASSVRKSILKSWKSATGSLAQEAAASGSSSKSKRPSLVGKVRGSIISNLSHSGDTNSALLSENGDSPYPSRSGSRASLHRPGPSYASTIDQPPLPHHNLRPSFESGLSTPRLSQFEMVSAAGQTKVVDGRIMF